MDITYTPTGGLVNNVGNYPLLIKLTSSNFDFTQSTSDISSVPAGTNYTGTGGADIRFTRADGVTDLPYQIERWNSTSQLAEIWVLVPSISKSTPTTIRMYFGKTGQTTTSSATGVFSTANKCQAVWHMNQGGTGNELDATQNGYTATATGTANPTTTSTMIGLGRNFAGGTASQCFRALTARSVTGFSQNGFYTISAWVNPTTVAASTYYTVIQKHDRQFALQITNAATNVWESAEYNADSGGAAGATPYGWHGAVNQTTRNAVTGVHYLVGQHEGFYHRLYYDGALVYNNGGSTGVSSPGTNTPILDSAVTIGRQAESTNGRPWLGNLDEIRMHNTVRDSSWLKADFQTQSPTGTAVTYGATTPTSTDAPSGISYSSNPASYDGGSAITPNTATLSVGYSSNWTVTPALPTGLSLNSANGTISGTPTVATGAANYQVKATNNFGADSTLVNLTVNAVAPSNLVYSNTTYTFGANQSSTSVTPSVNKGGLVATYTSDPLPAGLSIDGVTGIISGTPTTGTATATYNVYVTNTSGSTSIALSITVLNPIATFTYDTHTLTLGKNVAMTADNATVTGTDPFTPVKFFVGTTLPAGLVLDSLTGTVSGTPTVNLAATKYGITAKNGITAFNRTDTLTISIPNAPTALTYSSNTPIYEDGQAIATNSPSPSGTTPFLPVTYAVTAGSLPAGLTLNADGTITGTVSVGASASSPYAVSITATNPSGSATDSILVITVLSSEDYSGWTYNKSMTLNTSTLAAGVTTAQTNFPVLVRLTGSHATVFSQAMANGEDIRFTNGSGTHLPYQIERWSFAPGDTSAAIWVAADNVAASNTTTIKMYWGNGSATSRSNGAAVFSSGYVGVWHLGDATGIDPRPNAVAGAPTAKLANNFTGVEFGGGAGTYVIPNGVIGKADTLRGGGTRAVPTAASDYLNIGDNADSTQASNTAPYYQGKNTYTGYSNFSTGFTYSLWVKPTQGAAGNFTYMLELATTNGASNNIQFFRPNQDSVYRYEHVNNTTSGGTKSSNASTMKPFNTWQHIVVTVGTGSTPTVNLYKNGATMFTASNATNAMANILRTNAWIGKSNYTGDFYFRGAFDEPEISNVARSSDWIRLTYKNQKTGVTPVFDLSYSTPTASYTFGSAITTNSPSVTGNATRYSVSPTLPAGLTLSSSTGAITGTPSGTASSATDYTITALSDSAWSTTATVNITVLAALPTVAYTPTSVSYRAGDIISKLTPTISTGGETPVITVSPSLPSGLSLNSTTGVISGAPTSAQGAADYVFTATNSSGSSMDTVNITVTAGEDYSSWTYHSDMTLNTTTAGANVSTGVGSVPVLVRLTGKHAVVFNQA